MFSDCRFHVNRAYFVWPSSHRRAPTPVFAHSAADKALHAVINDTGVNRTGHAHHAVRSVSAHDTSDKPSNPPRQQQLRPPPARATPRKSPPSQEQCVCNL
uniref:Uncharacterized protein n=1 Tax=Knipowitschia caucasica TaxID=637954 RepID=A0AAV2KQK7_KNICA